MNKNIKEVFQIIMEGREERGYGRIPRWKKKFAKS